MAGMDGAAGSPLVRSLLDARGFGVDDAEARGVSPGLLNGLDGGDVEPLPVVVDSATDGGGWVLILAYAHEPDDVAPLVPDSLPVSGVGYSHMQVATMSALGNLGVTAEDVDDVRFFAATSAHERVIHFRTGHPRAIGLAWDGSAEGNSEEDWQAGSGCELLPGHSANLPKSCRGMEMGSCVEWSTGAGLTCQTFFDHGKAYWNIGHHGRWEVDDHSTRLMDVKATTVHNVWIRFKPGCVAINGDVWMGSEISSVRIPEGGAHGAGDGAAARPAAAAREERKVEDEPDAPATSSLRVPSLPIKSTMGDFETPAPEDNEPWHRIQLVVSVDPPEDLAPEHYALAVARGGLHWNGQLASITHPDNDDAYVDCFIDFDSPDGPWVLILAYAHGARFPGTELLADVMPVSPVGFSHMHVQSIGTMLGIDLTPGDIQQVRFYGISSTHERVLHFKTDSAAARHAAFNGSNARATNDSWSKGWRKCRGHTSKLPKATKHCKSQAHDDLGLTDHTFYKGGELHWNIGVGHRFEVDDFSPHPDPDKLTLHQVWVKLSEEKLTLERPSAVGGVGSPRKKGVLRVKRQPSLDEHALARMVRPEEYAEELQKMYAREAAPDSECMYCSGTGKRFVAMQNVYDLDVQSAAARVCDESEDGGGPEWLSAADNQCWVCRGTGKNHGLITALTYEKAGAEEEKGGDDSDDEGDLCDICFTDPAQYGVSTECAHFYCGDCIGEYLKDALARGVAPCFCPGCKETAPEGETPDAGRIESKALTFLEQHGVVDKEFQFRFMRLQNAKEELFFRCPAACGNLLVDVDPRFVVNKGDVAVKVERCPCGVGVCVQCHQQVADDNMDSHTCPAMAKSRRVNDKAARELMGKLGKKCPNCDMFVIKDGGCDYMFCGTVAHGKLYDAIRAGGCGLSFTWSTLKPVSTFFINLEDRRVTGQPIKMYKDEIKKLRAEFGIKTPRKEDTRPTRRSRPAPAKAAGAGRDRDKERDDGDERAVAALPLADRLRMRRQAAADKWIARQRASAARGRGRVRRLPADHRARRDELAANADRRRRLRN